MQKKRDTVRFLIPVLFLALATATAVLVAQIDMPARDDLARLKNALESAGATALTTTQETSIQTLIANFRSAHKPSQNTTLQTARTAFENAILNGDSSTAASQALVMGNSQAAEMVQRESDAAVLAINVLNVLKTQAGQWDALVAKLGSTGTVRLLLNLAGGPGPGGHGGPGFGGPGRGDFAPQGMRRGAPSEF